MSLEIVSGPLFGRVALITAMGQATIEYTAPHSFIGTDMLVYSICDLGIPSSCCSDSQATVAIYVLSSPSSTTLTGSLTSGIFEKKKF